MIIDKEFETLIPPLSADEYRLLEESILAEGCRDALVTWHGILIDGHNRYRICTQYGLPFSTIETELEDRNAVKVWMMKNQLARRNLTDFQRCEMVSNVSDAVKEEAKKRQENTQFGGGGNIATTEGKSRDILGSMAGVSGKTYEHAVKVMEQGTEETKEALRRGEMSINQAYTELQKPHVAFNSGNNEWYTPSEYIEAARAVMGEINLDPASSEIANKTVKADHIYTVEDNGLEKPWFGNVWLNPPYASDLIGKFAEKGDKVSDFFRVNAWRQQADFCAKYLAKGSKVYVRGELQPVIYDGRDGKARLDLSVQADRVENLTEKPKETPKPNLDEFEDISSDDLPFGR